MIIEKNDIDACIRKFLPDKETSGFEVLADGPDHYVPYDVIRKIIRVDFTDNTSAVIKFVREAPFPKKIIESQSAFSDYLGECGIQVPYRYRVNGSYCITYEKDGLEMEITLEECLSHLLEKQDLQTMEMTGNLLGRIHKYSLDYGKEIGFSLLFDEVANRDTTLERLWGKNSHTFIDDKRYERIQNVYDKRIQILKNNWGKLPKAPVQGDIYGCNNLAWKNNELCVFDFNLAGDEVLLGDILLCWFRTIFGTKVKFYKNEIWCRECWIRFMYAYEQIRPITEQEKKILPDIYAILGTVYFVKLLVFYLENETKVAEDEIAYFEKLININIEQLEW